MRTQLMTSGGTHVSLRPASPDDISFLHALHYDRLAPELPVLDSPPAEQQAFVDMQFAAQQAGYAAAFPFANHWLVTIGDEPVGRLLLDQRTDEYRVVDVVVQSAHRRLGIGTTLLREVMSDAGAAGLPVRLSALAHERGLLRWYRRLGFVVRGERGPRLLLGWPAEPEPGG